MADTIRLNKVLRELNISIDRVAEFLESKGHIIEKRPTTKISADLYGLLCDEFQVDADKKLASKEAVEAKNKEEAVDICMAGRDVDENNPDYTNDIIEIYQEELHYVGGEK